MRNAPSTFQHLLNMVVSGLEGRAVYLDDDVIYSNTWEEHLAHIKKLLDHRGDVRLTVNLAKCEFAKTTIICLGKVVGQGKVCAVQAKVSAIETYPVPPTKKELQCFFDLVRYYRSFCKNFSTV